ncbi:DEAH-box RNA helicase PRP16 NDAI_0E04960 [Naumovozyma dairenensis CBS 421]|uniref:RNA helicase n=1 Tax=Naumovozyma dairenensis (strain ATCC 10597 / BCRC 20456 / CBS 421 / NBRC 0211 / NRRL Y-12639) TaxID=1071378 RepID=G0WAP0_NAUDC|nr:hypothetical protein NDAI_0E04960 [Naumovozyma dairenensis CBS 421]CCD25313.1 hypothetical protein NDAI_0E04960 [Naumovozyma dairenensis CBS 421]
MSKNEENLISLIQERTSLNVTTNFLIILKKLAIRNKGNVDNFKKSCLALGKFNTRDEFLEKLFDRLTNSEEIPRKEAVTVEHHEKKPHPPSSNKLEGYLKSTEPSLPQKRTKFKVSLNFDDSGSEDEGDDENLDTLIPSFKPANELISHHSTDTPLFKRKLNKDTASKLKEYSPANVKKLEPKLLLSKSDTSGNRLVNPSARLSNNASSLPHNKRSEKEYINLNDDANGIEDEKKKILNSEITTDDVEWYNYDDSGAPTSEEVELIHELNFSKKTSDNFASRTSNQDTLHSEIQLYSLSIEQRKNWLPFFLKNYSNIHNISNSMILGSFTEDPTHIDGLINPFRNPGSKFSQNARLPSKLVRLRRLQNDQTEKSKQDSNIVGTQLGEVLGIKQSNSDDLKESTSEKNNTRQTVEEIKEDVKATRRSLPIYKTRSDLLRTIRENQVIVIIGETGSGKTTQLAQYIYEDGFCNNGKMIGCTQPRRVAAMSVAKRVATEMDVKLGEEVGYSIRFEDQTSSGTKIKFMTDGILLRETLLDNSLDKYSCIIIDEAHERSLNTDVLLGLFKTLLTERRDLKLIITSATMNAQKFSNFFGNAPQFTIPGRTFPVKVIYSKYPVDDYVDAAVTEAVRIHLSTPITSGDILIFMTGQEDIETAADSVKEKLLNVYMKKYGISTFDEINDIEILQIYSALPANIQNKIFQKYLNENKRKIVIATNIAETSLTIDGIRYVIDCGYSKLKVYNPKIGLDSLTITPIALTNAIQRSGRAGRTGPGVAYRLYTEETSEDDMYPQAIPEIQRTNLSNTVLLLKSLDVDDVLKFPFLDPPPLQTLLTSLYELWFNEAIDNKGVLTPLGRQIAKFPLQPSLSKILLISSQNGCSEEMVTIVSLLSVPQVFYRPKERQEESDMARKRFFISESDHLTLLNVYSQWKSNNYSSQWCQKHFLQYKSLVRAADIRSQLLTVMERQGIEVVSSGSDWNIIRKCICYGFSQQAAKISGLGKYVHLRTGMDVHLHPTSALYGLGDLPSYVVYHELLMTTKEYICCVTSVDPFWLMDSGFLLYDIRRSKEIKEDKNGMFGGYSNEDEETEIKDDLDFKVENCLNKRNLFLKNLESFNKNAKVEDTAMDNKLNKTKKQRV